MAHPRLALRQEDFRHPGAFAPALERLAAGDSDTGYQLLLEGRERDPDDPKGPNFLGMVHFSGGRFDTAAREFSLASAMAPGVSAYACNEASAWLLADRPREAFGAYVRSLRGDELLPDAHRWAWSALSGTGEFDGAVRALRQALRDTTPSPARAAPADRPDLGTVTLCAIDCADPDLAARSLRRSMDECRFGAVLLLTSRPCHYEGITTVAIDHIGSVEHYSRFVMKDLWRHIESDHALVTQWDGYVVNGAAWSTDFLDHDFIGASWDAHLVREWGAPASHAVGNGGFSLRSARFLQAGADPQFRLFHPEDEHLCRTYRHILEQEYGIRFADIATADRFSFEANRPDAVPFGFHGAFNVCCFEPDPWWMRFGFLKSPALPDSAPASR